MSIIATNAHIQGPMAAINALKAFNLTGILAHVRTLSARKTSARIAASQASTAVIDA